MKITITLNYRDETYTSNAKEVLESELREVEEFIEEVAKGNAEYFCIENGNHEYYFPEKVLQESIITITKVK